MATAKGHLDLERKNLQSTATSTIDIEHFPPKATTKSLHCYSTIIPAPDNGKTYTDQTGRFPYQSSRGNKYIFLLYNYDANAILCEAIKK